ncbi:MAG TPA: hypothetical protein VNZ53_04180 [Steroidobacteraceae bacterium]|jgi:hypothetical protein|nr:hypothetical protein [Steroidobacteraceae bacterium]
MKRKKHHRFDDFGDDEFAGRGAHSRGVLAIGAAVVIGALASRSNKGPLASRSNNGPLEADCSGSKCFDELIYEDGVVTAVFAKDGSEYPYEMTRQEAKEWFEDESLGGYFNDVVR